MDGVVLRIAGVRIYYCVLSVRINGYTERQMGPLLVGPYQTCAAYMKLQVLSARFTLIVGNPHRSAGQIGALLL